MAKLMETWVVINDIQIPYEDKRVLALVCGFIADLKPSGVILNGDIVDCYAISDFVPNPRGPRSIMPEVRGASKLMGAIAPHTSSRIWIGGNHEDRLRRYEWKRIPQLADHPDLTFEGLFKLDQYGFKFLPYGSVYNLGKLMVTHGSLVSKHSAISAKNHFDKYGTSVLVGHTHRLGVYYKRNVRGIHGAWENGCLCKLTPEYAQHPDWQQGFSVVNVWPGGRYSVQQLPILPGPSFMYGGEYIKG
jgi:predicted phosphodiesterase